MRIDAARPNLFEALQQQQQQRAVLRVLEGDVSALPVRERLSATVVQTTSAGTLLNLRGNRILVEGLPDSVRPGTDLMVRIAGLFPEAILEMDTGNRSSPDPAATGGKSLLALRGGRDGAPQLLNLEVGQEVMGQVKEALSGERMLVDVKGTLVEAELRGTLPEAASRGQLKAGSELPLRVEQLQPSVVFRILDQAASILTGKDAVQILQANLSNQTPVGQTLQTLQQALANLTGGGTAPTLPPGLEGLQSLLQELIPGNQPPTAERLAAFIQEGGLQLESKLAQLAKESGPQPSEAVSQTAAKDLKAQLLSALKEADTSPTPLPGLREAIAGQLSQTETQQAVNLLAQLHSQPYFLQIPFHTGQGLTTAYLSLEPDRQGGGSERDKESSGDRSFDILFQLDLEQLGQTRIDAHVTPEAVRAIFYVERGPALARLRAEIAPFRDQLLALGYKEVLLAANPLRDMPPEKQQKFIALAGGVPSSVSLLDVKA